MTISIDKSLYDNHYKTREELLKEGYSLSEERIKELKIKYPEIYNNEK